jgi:putative redox protein
MNGRSIVITKTKLKWIDGLSFDAELNGHHFSLDADQSVGGRNRGPRPKGLLLTALAGCTGMDVVSILKKMKISDFKLEISVSGETVDEHPKVYNLIYLDYSFYGNNIPEDKVKRSVELSETRYCAVSAILKKTAEIQTKIIINGETIK